MGTAFVMLLALTLGFATGLRSMVGLAAIAWGARLEWLSFGGTSLAFFAHPWAVVPLTAALLGEFVGDKLPKTPSRRATGPFAARVVLGALCGAALALDARLAPALGGLAGVVGAVAGTLGGYAYRVTVPKRLRLADFPFAVLEDLVAVGLAYLAVSRFA